MNPLEALHQQFLEEKRKLALAEQQDNDSRTTEPTVATTEAMSTDKVKDPHAAYKNNSRRGRIVRSGNGRRCKNAPLRKNGRRSASAYIGNKSY